MRSAPYTCSNTGRAIVAVDLAEAPAIGALRVPNRVQLFEGDFFGVEGDWLTATYDVAPNGKHFVMARALGDARSEIVVWVNWMDELRRRLGE